MKGLNWKAILAALAVYIVGAGIVELCLRYALGFGTHHWPIYGLAYIICIAIPSAVFAFLAGYVAAGNKSPSPLLNVTLFIALYYVVCVLLQFDHKIASHPRHTHSQKLEHWAFFLTLSFFGGYLRSRRQPKVAESVSEVLQLPISQP